MTVKEKIQRAAAAAVLSRMIKYVRKDPDTNLVKLIVCRQYIPREELRQLPRGR